MPSVTYERLASSTLSSAQSSISFSSISQSYSDLKLVINGLSVGTGDYNMYLRFNGSSGANYNYGNIQAGQVSLAASFTAGDTGINLIGNEGVNSIASIFIVDIMNYSQGSYKKSFLWEYSAMNSSSDYTVMNGWGSWNDASAITQVTVSPSGTNFDVGTVIALYGIARA